MAIAIFILLGINQGMKDEKILLHKNDYYKGGKEKIIEYLKSENSEFYNSAISVIIFCKDPEGADLIGRNMYHKDKKMIIMALSALEQIDNERSEMYIREFIDKYNKSEECINTKVIGLAERMLNDMKKKLR